MSYASDFDRIAELKRIQQKEYERVVEEIAERFSKNPIPSAPIYTNRSTMERKTSGPKLVKKRTPKHTGNK